MVLTDQFFVYQGNRRGFQIHRGEVKQRNTKLLARRGCNRSAVQQLVFNQVADEALALLERFFLDLRSELCGKQAIDGDNNQTGQMLSALLGWSQAAFASKVEISGDSATVTRESDGGLQTIKCKMPMIVTTDLRLNQPRYASLPNIMKAKKKPLEEKTAADYGVDLAPRLKVLATEEPAGRAAGIIVGSVEELVGKLKEEGLV